MVDVIFLSACDKRPKADGGKADELPKPVKIRFEVIVGDDELFRIQGGTDYFFEKKFQSALLWHRTGALLHQFFVLRYIQRAGGWEGGKLHPGM